MSKISAFFKPKPREPEPEMLHWKTTKAFDGYGCHGRGTREGARADADRRVSVVIMSCPSQCRVVRPRSGREANFSR